MRHARASGRGAPIIKLAFLKTAGYHPAQ